MKIHNSLLFLLLSLFVLAVPIALAASIGTTTIWNVPVNKSHSIAYTSPCSATAFFFNEQNAVADPDVDGNATKMLPFSARSTAGGTPCQDASTAPITVTNNGNTTVNLDANFAGALDTNVWLKAWKGTGSGCGTSGLGGWQLRCTVVSTTTAVTTSACKDFNSSNSLVASRLTTTLTAASTQQFCFSGEFMAEVIGQTANVGGGDHNGAFQTSTDVS